MTPPPTTFTVKRTPVITSWSQATDHLEMIAGTIRNDINPLLHIPGGAPHAVARLVFCYVDYLGAMLVGTSKNKSGTPSLAPVGTRFKTYLKDVLRLVDLAYCSHARLLYEMYRNGLIHEFDPKPLKDKRGNYLLWSAYQGQRTESNGPGNYELAHLKINKHPAVFVAGINSPVYILPICTNCLVQDLLDSIVHFKSGLAGC